jgi:DNA mismatch repair protein MutS
VTGARPARGSSERVPARAPGGGVGAAAAAPTALMRQYLEVKGRYPDAVVFFRLGDFYEMFYEDATRVAGLLDLTLTTRDRGKEDPVPMCGIPYHAARGYLAKLTALGHRVAICEQLEDPKSVRGIVKRDVVRVVTPGVTLDEESLDPRIPCHLAAVRGDGRRGFGLAFIDVTTGTFRATEAPTLEAMLDELARAEPRELVLRRGDAELAAAVRRAYPGVVQTLVEPGPGDTPGPGPGGTSVGSGPGSGGGSSAAAPGAAGRGADQVPWEPELAARAPVAVAAALAVLAYARATQPAATLPLMELELFHRADTLVIDEQARAHLELTETLLDRKRGGSLIELLDQTRSAMGGRLLRRWLLFPLVDVVAIRRRQDAIERLVGAHGARDAARKILGEVGDLERLVTRARLGVATPRDLWALGAGLHRLPGLARALEEAAAGEIGAAPNLETLGSLGGGDPAAAPDLGADLADAIARTLRDDAPAVTREGGFVRPGFSAELDELVAIAAGGREGLVAIELRERARTGIPSLKVKFNSVFGYYIEVTRAQMDRVPADYVRKQTVANAERFVTPELGDYESKILSADERRIALELEIFTALRAAVAGSAVRLLALARRVATADVLAGLAEVAHRGDHVRPLVDDSSIIDLEDSRHPVVERLAAAGGFVPNDVRLDSELEQILIVTGPNMAGKSTLIRQVALTVILAQMGAFVPARRARIGVCDRVFTRVGAGDNLSRGESTFLVEMRETAHILRYATARSLIVLDEIGRGTSTYDGVSIAWAVAEHLHESVGAKTLFATHYHELCALAERHPRVRNVSVAAREWEGEVVFLRKLTPGGANRSFGIQVARLAGLPPSVIDKAREILATLEASPGRGASPLDASAGAAARGRAPGPAPLLGVLSLPATPGPQLRLFDAGAVAPLPPPGVAEVVRTLKDLDPDELSPRRALDLLVELRNKLI